MRNLHGGYAAAEDAALASHSSFTMVHPRYVYEFYVRSLFGDLNQVTFETSGSKEQELRCLLRLASFYQ